MESIDEIQLIFDTAISEKNYTLALKAKEIILKQNKNQIVLTKYNLKNLIQLIDEEIEKLKVKKS